MDISAIMKIIDSYLVLLIPMTLGLTEVVKRFIPDKILVKFTPVISLVIAVISAFVVIGFSREAVLAGIFVGLSASGLWDIVTDPFKKKDG